jgi:hypothetical protein
MLAPATARFKRTDASSAPLFLEVSPMSPSALAICPEFIPTGCEPILIEIYR